MAESEPVTGPGDNTSPDWLVIKPMKVLLRAEKSGRTASRICTIYVQCIDDSNNSTTITTQVVVPHDVGM